MTQNKNQTIKYVDSLIEEDKGDNEFEVPNEEINVNHIQKSVERVSALSAERQ